MIIMDNYMLDDLKHYVADHLIYKCRNKVVDDFISYINTNSFDDILEFVPYCQFKEIEFIAEGECYKTTWIDGYIKDWNKEKMNFKRSGSITVILKRLNNSESITFEELNEVQYYII